MLPSIDGSHNRTPHPSLAHARGRRGPPHDERVQPLDRAPLFSERERERAALALTEAITLLPQAGVPDALYEAAAQEFPTPEIAQLLMAIAAINSWNRLMVASGAIFKAPEDSAS